MQPMSEEIAKTYDPASIEAEIYPIWLAEKCFAADPAAPGEPYCIVIPPPNVTGALHLGHAINDTLQDILIRTHRMRGFNALWIPGIDHAGIATQAVVEKQLKEKENKTRHDVGREGLVERIWQWKQQYGDRILEQLKRMGCSCDWDRTRFTLDDMCARAVRETFFKLFKDGLIYRGKRLVNWDAHLQTSISDDEIYHETVKTSLWHIRYPIVGLPPSPDTLGLAPSPGTLGEGRGEGLSSGASEDAPHATKHAPHPSPLLEYRARGSDEEPERARPAFMTVATTRPETLLGDTCVAVHSQDPRWNWAIGKSVELPLTGRKIPIIADDILVDPKFGSGVVKVTPAHDPNDYAVWQRHQEQGDKIEIINILNPDGTINANGGKYQGMKRDAARKKVVEDLTALGLLEKEEPYETQVGHSDRSKTPVEPYLSDQWFVKMAPLAEPALEVVREGIIKFFPERHAQQYLAWLGEKRDWPISRQLWWGHRIPVWSKVIEEDSELAKFTPTNPELHELCSEIAVGDASMVMTGPIDGRVRIEFCPRYEKPSLLAALKRQSFVQDPDVLDTWFSSALWPHSTLGWPDDTLDLRKWYPTSVLVTGRDIITLWVARMVMMGMYNMRSALTPSPCTQGEGRGEGEFQSSSVDDKNPHPYPLPEYRERGSEGVARQLGIPFHHVAINPTILDGKGERMSKSKGNGVDPVDVVDTHGADALRFTLTMMATETQDVRMPVKKDAQGRNTSDKFDIGSRFCNKIWQVAHFFVISNLKSIPAVAVNEGKWSLADRWIVSRFNRAVKEADAALAAYRFDQYGKICYDFFYGDFCDWYVEMAKPALKDASTAPQTANVLAAVLDGALRLMHPMIPFITEMVWGRLNAVREERGLGKRLVAAKGKRIIKVAWPFAGPVDEQAEALFPRIQQVISAIRALRSDHKVDVKKVVDASIVATPEMSPIVVANRVTIELLGTCRLKTIAQTIAPPAGAVRTWAAGCDIFVEGLVNEEAEKQRVAKQREDLTRKIVTLRARLSNESYVAKAPPDKVKETRDELAAAEAELAKLA
jgi:valyl-tRNA synthetase